jgi:hypothetical protein
MLRKRERERDRKKYAEKAKRETRKIMGRKRRKTVRYTEKEQLSGERRKTKR